ncbi:zinc finger protein 423 [Caerostris extrusa]|uniref:Zinc finger protein 423 n=1 Tax=Caerostris extrusa TaxID=172846 RepID=A0AAV4SY33_CAEEX|nr:zinc finger protein 423 [Caerostris extrusa]
MSGKKEGFLDNSTYVHRVGENSHQATGRCEDAYPRCEDLIQHPQRPDAVPVRLLPASVQAQAQPRPPRQTAHGRPEVSVYPVRVRLLAQRPPQDPHEDTRQWKPYQCTVCNRGCHNTAAALSSHMQNHKKITEPPTDLPVAPYTRGSTPNDHQGDKDSREEDSPDPPKPLLCNFCPQVCSSPNALGDHMLQSHRSFSSSSPLSDSPRPPSSRGMLQVPRRTGIPQCYLSPQKGPRRDFPSMKLTCGFCSKSDFPTFESLQLHVQVLHVPTGTTADSALAASLRSLQSMLHSKRPHHGQNAIMDNFIGFSGMECDSSLTALHILQKHAAMNENLMLKRPNDIYCSQCNIGFTSSTALLDHVRLVHETTLLQSPLPFVPHQQPLQSYASSRLRPNGAKHLKTSNALGSHSAVFNGTASSHYRRQDPGGGQNIPTGQYGEKNSIILIVLEYYTRGVVVMGITSPETTPNTLLCSQCNAGFSDFESFRTHLKSHLDAAAAASTSGQGPASGAAASLQLHTCPECSAEFSSESPAGQPRDRSLPVGLHGVRVPVLHEALPETRRTAEASHGCPRLPSVPVCPLQADLRLQGQSHFNVC